MNHQQPLPHATLILIFGILSILCCCCYGVFWLVFGIIALVLANKSIALHRRNPELYTQYNNVRTGRVLAIIGIVLSALYIVYIIFLLVTIGYEAMAKMGDDWMMQQSL